MIEGRDIVCLSSLDWDAHWTSKHQIMHRLAKTNRVLYVNEPATMLSPFLISSHWKRWGALVPRIEKVEDNLWTLTLPPVLPFGNRRSGFNRVNQAVVARYVRWAMKKLDFSSDHIFWTYLPATVGLLNSLYGGRSGEGPALVIYHCVDEHSAFPGHFISPGLVRSYDDELTRRADLVITTSENLRESREALNSHTYTVLNAVDADLFAKVLSTPGDLPADLVSIPEPRIGIVGVHDYRLDVDAVEALAQDDPGWQVVLIGPLKLSHEDVARLRRLPLVHLLGAKHRQELPSYLRGLSAALIPYRVCELTRNIFPLKLFEYLAAGLPVVAGGLPELKRYEGMVYLAHKIADYSGLIRAAITEDSPEKRVARVVLAAENSWTHRVYEISGLVEDAFSRKTAT